MKFLPYILKNVLRNKRRTLFTSLSIAVCLFLVTILYAYLAVREEFGNLTKQYNRIVVMHSEGLTHPVPIAHVDRIRTLPGVKAAVPMNWFGGRYKDESFMSFSQFGTDPEFATAIMEEYEISPAELQAWKDDRTGCVAGTELCAKKGWKIGERIVLKGDIYPVTLELTLRGMYRCPDKADGNMLWYQWTYLDEQLRASRSEAAGNAGTIQLTAASAAELAPLMDRIEAKFANSDAPVRPMTEQAFNALFTEMLGNVESLIRNTALAVVFSLICVSGNAMAMSMRERTREVSVLKAVGFGRKRILAMVLVEAVLIAILGGLLGTLAAKWLLASIDTSFVGMLGIPKLWIPWSTAASGVLLAAIIGLVSGLVPAYQAAQLSVVDGLRKIV